MTVALDIGGSSVKAGRVARAADGAARPVGEIIHLPIDHEASASELIERFAAAASRVGADDEVALAMPAPFDYETGISSMTHKFAALHGVDVVEGLAAALGHPTDIRCCNDAEAAIVGESVAGAGVGFGRVLGITLGTGFGAALVVDGRPVREAGGVVVGELYARPLGDGRVADDALSARGYQARRSAEGYGRELGAFLRPVVGAVEADIVVVGGGGAASFERFAGAVQAELPVAFVRATLDVWAPIIGAAHICFG